MTMGPGGGSDPGNAGRGGGRNSGRGSTGGGGPGRDTPGSPNAADGRRGSSMGPDGGVAPDSGNRDGRQTPGAPENTNRQGQNATGTTSRSRARDAMSRHAREGFEREAREGTYSLAGELKAAEDEGTMSPRERDMAIGLKAGTLNEGFMGSVGGLISQGINGVTGMLGLGKIGETAAEAGLNAMSVPDNPESTYGAAVGKQNMQNSTMQDAAEGVAGFFGGPMAGMATGMVNTAANLNANKDAVSLNADIDARNQANTPGRSRPGDMGNSRVGNARNAMAGSQQSAPNAPRAQGFEWAPVDANKYSYGLLKSAMNR